MYTTTVKIKKILEKKQLLKLYSIIMAWGILTLISIIMLIMTYLAVVMLIIDFLMLIPLFYHVYKTTAEFKGDESFINKEITFNVINRELYVDNIKLHVSRNKKKIIVQSIDRYFLRSRYVRDIKHDVINFLGIVEEPYLDDFVNFLNEQGVIIHKTRKYNLKKQ